MTFIKQLWITKVTIYCYQWHCEQECIPMPASPATPPRYARMPSPHTPHCHICFPPPPYTPATHASPPPHLVVRRNNTRLWKHDLPAITVLGGNDKKGHNIVNDKTYWFKRIFAWFVSYEWHCNDKRSQLWMTHRDAQDDSPGLPNSHQDKIPSVFLVFLAFPGVFYPQKYFSL